MNDLWAPFPEFDGAHDPFDDANYKWAISDDCLAGIYENSELQHPLDVQIRLGHSRSLLADNPSFSAVPNNITKWGLIATHIMERYITQKKYPIRDWSVWNEPGGGCVIPRLFVDSKPGRLEV
jgi:hypothetical protein